MVENVRVSDVEQTEEWNTGLKMGSNPEDMKKSDIK